MIDGMNALSGSSSRTEGLVNNPRPRDIRVTESKGGFIINKFGNTFYPVEVCVTIEEVVSIVRDFYTDEEQLPPAEPKIFNPEPEQGD